MWDLRLRPKVRGKFLGSVLSSYWLEKRKYQKWLSTVMEVVDGLIERKVMA